VALHQLSYPAVWFMNEGHEATRQPRGAHPSIAPSQLVRTRDGWGFLMCQTPKFWSVLCQLIGRPDLETDTRFVTTADRHRNLAALTEELDTVFSVRDTGWWSQKLAGVIPFSPVNDVAHAINNPFVAEIGMVDRVDHPAKPGGLAMLACPIVVDRKRLPAQRAPRLGEHDAEFGIVGRDNPLPESTRTG
jgi:crotonobetainyl-CoA:carnitine CoA-transferase CaiB-like acyl-CoA transferase